MRFLILSVSTFLSLFLLSIALDKSPKNANPSIESQFPSDITVETLTFDELIEMYSEDEDE